MSRPQAWSLRDIDPAKRAYNADRSRVLGWYVARHDEDRYDETTEYRVALFDAETEEELVFLVTSVHERSDTGEKTGEHLESAAFDAADEDVIVMRFVDGTQRRRRIDDLAAVPEAGANEAGVVVSDVEKRVLERMRARAEELKKKLKKPKPPRKS